MLSLLAGIIAFLIPVSFAVEGTFEDVPSTAAYADAIEYLRSREIISGYKDNTYRPERTVNRAEFVKVLTKLLISPNDIDECVRTDRSRFSDVPMTSWFAPFVCAAKKEGLIDGATGTTFRPSDTINIAEASKILSTAFHLQSETSDSSLWYRPYVTALADADVIPVEVKATGESLTRGVMAEMLWRLKEGKKDRPAANASALIAAQCDWFVDEAIPRVDLQEVRRVWTKWINDVRANMNLAPYTQDKQLTKTATLWSQRSRDIGSITHKRPGQTAYYDYKGIEGWFATQNLDFTNVKSTTFTENIGWGVFKCAKDDCTQDLLTAVRTTFDFYMSEKGKAYSPHYNSIVKPEFRLMGTGIAVDAAKGRYYLTAHYATSIASDPDPVCP